MQIVPLLADKGSRRKHLKKWRVHVICQCQTLFSFNVWNNHRVQNWNEWQVRTYHSTHKVKWTDFLVFTVSFWQVNSRTTEHTWVLLLLLLLFYYFFYCGSNAKIDRLKWNTAHISTYYKKVLTFFWLHNFLLPCRLITQYQVHLKGRAHSLD